MQALVCFRVTSPNWENGFVSLVVSFATSGTNSLPPECLGAGPPVPAARRATVAPRSPSFVERKSALSHSHQRPKVRVRQLGGSAPAPLRACAHHHSSWVTLRLRFNLPQPGVSIIRAAPHYHDNADDHWHVIFFSRRHSPWSRCQTRRMKGSRSMSAASSERQPRRLLHLTRRTYSQNARTNLASL